MPDELSSTDPLLQAIGEFRGFIDRLIDEQKTRLSALDEEFMQAVALHAQDEVGTASLAVATWEPRTKAATRAAQGERPTATAVRAPRKATAEAASARLAKQEAHEEEHAGPDPKTRLDALAKHLDKQLRR